MGWTARLRNLLRGRALDGELEEELRYHLDARTRDNIGDGMAPEDARQDAVRRFGNQTLTKELTRESDIVASLETVAQDLSYAFRSLRRNPGFTAVAVAVLALGIGANTAIFTVVNGVLLRPLPYPEPDRLFFLSYAPKQSPFFTGPSMSDRDYLEFRRQDRLFEATASFAMSPATLTRAGDPVRLAAASVTPDFLRVLRADPALGRGFLAEDTQAGRSDVVVLGDKLWHGRFGGDPGILGKTVTLDGTGRTVVGIMPPGFAFPSRADLWLPMEIRLEPGNFFSRPVIGRLRPGVPPGQAQSVFETFAAGLPLGPEEKRSEFAARVVPFKDEISSGVRKSLLIFAGAVAFVLLIACANVANLLLIRAASRRHEIGVRLALGAGRVRLIRQLLTESILVSVAGGAAGTLVAAAGVPALLALAPDGRIPRAEEIHLDAWALAFTLGLSVLTGIAFGLAPAFQATRRELRESLSECARTLTGRNERLRSALVISEIALTLVLLAGAGLLLKSFLRIRSVNPGFRPDNVLTVTVELPDSRYRSSGEMRAFHQRAVAKLSSLPGVVAAGAVNWMPLGRQLVRGDLVLEGGRRLPPRYTVDKPAVSAGYFRAMGIRLLRGRDFTERDDAAAPGVAIVSESAARTLWPSGDAIGRRISLESRPKPEDWLTVVGVVDDVRQKGLTSKPSHAIYQPLPQVRHPFFLGQMTYLVRTASHPAAVAGEIRAALREIDPDQPVESIAPMREVIAGTTAEPRFQTALLGVFSVLALLLSAVGLYGVLACSVAERAHEIGIRMAVGAGRGDVTRMVLRRTLALAGAGIALGTAGALAVTRLLEHFLFEVKPADPETFVAVAALLLAVAVVAGLVPARRASAVDPLVALRYQ